MDSSVAQKPAPKVQPPSVGAPQATTETGGAPQQAPPSAQTPAIGGAAAQIPGLEKYRKVERAKEASRIDEVRVTGRGRVVMYVSYIARLFAEAKRPITVRATGKAVSIAVSVVEVAKRRFKGLHQVTSVGVTDIVDEYEPLEAGLEKQSFTRSVTFISILLTFDDSGIDKNAPGYQAPLPDSMIDERAPEELVNPTRRGGRGGGGRGSRRNTARGRGGMRTSDDQADVTGGTQSPGGERGRGRGRPRGRRTSGSGREGSVKGQDQGQAPTGQVPAQGGQAPAVQTQGRVQSNPQGPIESQGQSPAKAQQQPVP